MAPLATLYGNPATTAERLEQAAPNQPNAPAQPLGSSTVRYRGGPGDVSFMPGVDDWVDPDMYDVTHNGAELGDALRIINPAKTPPEGHGGWDIPASEYGPFINASTRTLAYYISDWNSSTAGKGCAGSFDGGHVVIRRVAPGSNQGYQPSQFFSPNQDRALPGPWDANLVIGGGSMDALFGGAQ